jgi:hypothetical protein
MIINHKATKDTKIFVVFIPKISNAGFFIEKKLSISLSPCSLLPNFPFLTPTMKTPCSPPGAFSADPN